jgi:hypothetical protein
MIRIIVTAEAYRALNDGAELPEHMLAREGGGYSLWLEPTVVNILKAARAHGESFSDTILRLTTEEVA